MRELSELLSYEVEPGEFGTDPACAFEENQEAGVCSLAMKAEVHLEDVRPRVLPSARYVELLDTPFNRNSVSDILAAEGSLLSAASRCEETRSFLRLMMLWSAYAHKIGSATFVYYTLCFLDEMADSWRKGDDDEVFNFRKKALATTVLARHPFRGVCKSVFSDDYLINVSIL